jgi:hypothetical protein
MESGKYVIRTRWHRQRFLDLILSMAKKTVCDNAWPSMVKVPCRSTKTALGRLFLQGPPPTGGTMVSANFVTESQAKFLDEKSLYCW